MFFAVAESGFLNYEILSLPRHLFMASMHAFLFTFKFIYSKASEIGSGVCSVQNTVSAGHFFAECGLQIGIMTSFPVSDVIRAYHLHAVT